MDDLLISLQQVCNQLLPVVGVVVLIYLVILLRKVLGILGQVDTLLKDVDRKMVKLNGPLDTFVRLSQTVDMMHDSAVQSVQGAIAYIAENMHILLAWMKEVFQKSKETKTTTVVNPQPPVQTQPVNVNDAKGEQ